VAEAGGSTSGGASRLAEQSRAESSGPVTVVVRRGDSLWSIARRYSVSTRQLMQWNKLSSTVIKPGDRIQIPR
jgi:membrane-bound lytic murein transglycosylase D